MKIFVDENIPLITVEELRSNSFDVADIRGSSEQGMPDEQLWLKVQKAGEIPHRVGHIPRKNLSRSGLC